MNKILFIHGEEKIKEDKSGNLYTDGCYNNKVWDRYFKISKDITAIFRKETKIYDNEIAKEKFQKLDNKIKFVQIENRKENIKKFLSIKLKNHNKKIIEQEVIKADIIIARVPSDDSYTAIKYAKKHKKKCLIEVVGCPFDTLWYHSIKGKILSIPSYIKLKNNVKKGDYVQYVTNNFLQKRYPTNKYQIGCSDVDIKEPNNETIEKRIKKIESFNSKNKIIIGTIGTLDVKYKGQSDVMKAIELLTKKGYNIEYRMVGAGSDSNLKKIAIKKNIYDKCNFIGSIQHEKIYDFIDDLDIYIHPSHTEGLCRSLIEVISRGCPSIASNAGGNPELIDSEYIYKKKNIQQMIAKIEKFINSKEEMKEQAIKNIKKANEYTNKNLDIKRNKIYSKLNSHIKNRTKVIHFYKKMDKGGAETFIMNIFREINKENFAFEFLCTTSEEGAYDKEIYALGGRIGHISEPSIKNPIKNYKELINYFKANGPFDVIHIPTMFYSGIVCRAAYKAGIPKIIVHSHSAKDRKSKNPLRFIYRHLMQIMIDKYATDKLSCGIEAANLLYGTSKNIEIINNGIKLDDYYRISASHINKLKKELDIDNELIIGNVARFVELKNQKFFIKIAEQLIKENKNFKIVLVGEGEEKNKLVEEIHEKKLEKYFILPGLRSDIPIFMNMFDVLVMPSLYEGFPLTVVEALASGTPCILSSNISKETKVIDNMVEFIDLENDITEWIKKINLAKKEDKNYTKKILTQKGFDIENTTRLLETIYRR